MLYLLQDLPGSASTRQLMSWISVSKLCSCGMQAHCRSIPAMSLDAVYAAETRSLTGTMCQLGQVVQQAAAAFQRLSQQV